MSLWFWNHKIVYIWFPPNSLKSNFRIHSVLYKEVCTCVLQSKTIFSQENWSFSKTPTFFGGIILRYLLWFWNAHHKGSHCRKDWILHAFWEHLLLCAGQHLRRAHSFLIRGYWGGVSGKCFTFLGTIQTLFFFFQYKLFKIIFSLCHCLWLFYGYSPSCFITTWWLILIKYGTVSAHLWSFGCLGWMPCPLQETWLLNAITLATTWWQHCSQRAHQIVELPAAVEPWPAGAR